MSKNDIAVVVLAAGKGTRMCSSQPKVLHKIAGVSMLRYVLSNVSGLAPKQVSVVIGPDMKDVQDEVNSWEEGTKCIVQKDQKGTGDAVRQAKNALKGFKGSVLILFGDTPFITDNTMSIMIERLNAEENAALVVLGFNPEDPAEYGRLVVDNAGSLQGIVEYKDADENQQAINLCNAGVMAVRGDLLFKFLDKIDNKNAKKEYYLTDLVSIARNEGYDAYAIEAEENEVMGINTREQLSYAESVVQHFLRWEAMHNGATMIAPETVFMSHDTIIGEDVVIHPNVVFGPGVTIEDGVEIQSFTHLEGVTVETQATVGPFARIRPESLICAGAKVGNFVEVKNSVLGQEAKAGHLSYIGDADVGQQTNIGAGTVVCNYDGKKKHKTYIGKKAFVGSNSSLVAPLRVGDSAVVGAGSTITKDVADKARVVNEMPIKEIKKKK